MALRESQWITVQQKTFTKWLNSKVSSRNVAVTDLVKDLCDGVILIHLLEVLGAASLGRYASHPKLRVQRFENANTALNFIKSRGIQMTNIGAEDVVDGNRKIILGLIWTLILRFTISDINEEGLTAKEGLLLWCQRKTACYEEVDVRDFSGSWNDGLAFCALLDIHRPDLINYDLLDKNDHRGNMQLAFDIASKEIGIPDLLDVEDVCDVAKPDERSLMTYIAYWFHAFSQMERVENAGRRVEKFVTNMQGAWEMQNSFERRMRELLRQITAQRKQWDEAVFEGTYADVKEQLNFFNRYKKAQKRSWVAEKSDLAALLGNIKTKMSTYRLRPYEPPADLSLEVLDRAWLELTQHERKRSQVINETIRDIKNTLRRTFAEKANSFANTLSTLSLACSSLDGDIDDQLAHIKRLHKSLPPLSTYLSSILLIHEKCEEANIEENDYTTYTYDELLYEHTLVVNGVAKKLAFLENQLVARDMTNLTPVQLEEFESVFRHFDRSGLNSLNEVEFSAALASLGLVYDEVEMHSKFLETVKSSKSGSNETNAISTNSRGASPTHGFSAGLGGITSPPHTPNHNRTRSMIPSTPSISHNGMNNSNVNSTTTAGRVSFEGFIRFMVGVTEDQNTAEQVFQSFREVADGKEWVTEVDLRHSLIPDELIEELVKGMPELEIGNGDGNGGRGEKDGSARGGESDGGERKYDYVTFMERMVAGGGSGSGSGGGSGSVQVRDEKENVNGGSSGIGNSWIGR